MTLLSTQFKSLQHQATAAPWLKWAALLCGALVSVYAILALDDQRKISQKAAINAEQSLKRVQLLSGQRAWLERESQAQEIKNALLAELPEVKTMGLAQAATQSWLRELSANYTEAQNIRFSVGAPGRVDSIEDVIKVNATFSGGMSPKESLALLRKIETSKNLITVETLTIRTDPPSSLHLTVNAYYRLAHQGES